MVALDCDGGARGSERRERKRGHRARCSPSSRCCSWRGRGWGERRRRAEHAAVGVGGGGVTRPGAGVPARFARRGGRGRRGSAPGHPTRAWGGRRWSVAAAWSTAARSGAGKERRPWRRLRPSPTDSLRGEDQHDEAELGAVTVSIGAVGSGGTVRRPERRAAGLR